MKSLILIRHAKSSWKLPELSDFDRPLNERGKDEAEMMAKKLFKREVTIDGFISSPAKRAKKTAKIFAARYERKKEEIIYIPELYAAASDVFYNVIERVDPSFDTIAIFAHNPGITTFANTLTVTRIDEIPTSGVFAVRIHTDSWLDFQEAEKEFWFFDHPRLKV